MRLSTLRGIAALMFALILSCPAMAEQAMRTAKSQLLYVPAYSHIYQGTKGRPYNLAIMLSIRNVNADKSLTVTTIKYYDDHGVLVKDYLTEPMTIAPMGTREIYIPDHDSSAGSGANFIVRWKSAERISTPIVQAVMIGTASTQGISFVCDGVVLEQE